LPRLSSPRLSSRMSRSFWRLSARGRHLRYSRPIRLWASKLKVPLSVNSTCCARKTVTGLDGWAQAKMDKREFVSSVPINAAGLSNLLVA
jgi:hypothetical protein